jgi:N-methylhydantoinase B/oxoprolinase/acetone carboxylase alpha subunit
MSIDAMKQALAALEKSVSTCFDRYSHEQVLSRPEHFINQTITALRLAIEQAERVKRAEEAFAAASDDMKGEQAERQGPVALETVYETVIHWDEGGGKRSRRELARRIVALYAAPPQRQRKARAAIAAAKENACKSAS